MPPVSSIPNALSFLKANLRSITALAAIIAGLMAPSAAAGDASREREVLRFALVRGPCFLESAARPNQHVEALGEEAGVWGSLGGGFEGWAYPFKLFDGWSLFAGDEGGHLKGLQSLATRHVEPRSKSAPVAARTAPESGRAPAAACAPANPLRLVSALSQSNSSPCPRVYHPNS